MATNTSPALRVTPVAQPNRIASIDVIRGFALLGILIMNIQSFGLIDAKYMNPTAQGELSTISYGCWWFAHVFFDLKFMALFSMLFGAGIALMVERGQSKETSVTGLHYRRMGWLLLIGLAHAHLLWIGDILVPYAVCGMVLYWLSGLRPRFLIPIGLFLIAIGSGLSILSGLSLPWWPEGEVTEMLSDWTPNAAQIQHNLEIHRASWLEFQPYRSTDALFMETFLFLFLFFWRLGGLMLVGMAMFKLGIFQCLRSTKFYSIGAICGLGIGLSLILTGVHLNHAYEWKFEYSFFLGNQFNYWGSLFMSFAYVCLVMLLIKSGVLAWLRKSLASVGQMALTNYLMHTIICTTIFYGHGLGWFGYLTRPQLLIVVVMIWLIQLTASPIWLRHFRFGPFEWLWRSLSYWSIQPMLRTKKS